MFPAHAGMMVLVNGKRRHRSCVPRPRGDDPMAIRSAGLKQMCSPPTRG